MVSVRSRDGETPSLDVILRPSALQRLTNVFDWQYTRDNFTAPMILTAGCVAAMHERSTPVRRTKRG